MPHHHHLGPRLPHHHSRGPHGTDGPEWFFNAVGDVDRVTLFNQIAEIAAELAGSGATKLGTTEIEIPDDVLGTVRFERTPHGTLAIVLKAEWSGALNLPVSSPIGALRNGDE